MAKLGNGIIEIITLIISILFINHVVACFWYWQCKLQDFPSASWINGKGMIDAPNHVKYIASYYWAFQTIATVGYGDINGKANVVEQVFCICWMIIGVAFYSYTIGNMTSLIAGNDDENEFLNKNMEILKNFNSKV